MRLVRRIGPIGLIGLIGLINLTVSCPAHADDEPILTDRPDFTETAETVPFGRVQVESGYTFATVDDERSHSLGEILIRIATGRRTEARIGLNSHVWTHSPGGRMTGLEDISLGLKIKLVKGAETPGFGRPDIALIVDTSIPTGARAYRVDELQPGAKLCLAWSLTDRLGLASNLNYASVLEDRRFGQFSGTVSFGYSLNDRMGAYLEFFTFVPAARGGPNANYLDSGVTYLVNPDHQLDFRIGIGLNSARPDYFAGAGISRRW